MRLATLILVIGCDRSRLEKHDPPPATASQAARDEVRPDPCEAPFPPARLAELANDRAAVEPWGPKLVDEVRREVTALPSTGKPGDPDAVAAAWQLPLPASYADFLRRFDGANVRGADRVEIWNTSLAVEIARDGGRPLQSRPGARFVSIGTDGGSREIVIDLDDWSGRGRCSVVFVSQGASDVVTFIAPDFAAAIDRVIRGPELELGEDRIVRPAP